MTFDFYKKWYMRYTLAAAVIVASVLLRLALIPVIGTGSLYIVLTPAIMIVAVTFGVGPGLFGTVLGLILVEFFLIEPAARFRLSAALEVRWSILLLTSFYIGRVAQRLRDLRAQAAAEIYETRRAAEQTLGQTNAELTESRRSALNLMEDAIAARDRAEQINRKLHLLQEKEKADAIRLARAQTAASTIRAMHEGVMLLELDGTILFVNPAVDALTGLFGRAIVGRKLESLLPAFMAGKDLSDALQGLTVLHSGGVPEFHPLLLHKKDGCDFFVLPSVSIMDPPEEGGVRWWC